jgi:hypothetical protein
VGCVNSSAVRKGPVCSEIVFPHPTGTERFEICEVVPTVHGDRVAQVLATATTASRARLAVQTIQRECGIEPSRMRIYDTLRRRWLGPHRLEQREEP